MEIKKLNSSYLNNILEMEKNFAPPSPYFLPYDKQELREELESENIFYYGLFDNNKLIAFASYENKGNGTYFMAGMIVDDEYRRKGLGQKLFDLRLNEIKKNTELKDIYVTCYPKNTPIIMLYLKNGFYIGDLKKDYYGPGNDRVFLRWETNS